MPLFQLFVNLLVAFMGLHRGSRTISNWEISQLLGCPHSQGINVMLKHLISATIKRLHWLVRATSNWTRHLLVLSDTKCTGGWESLLVVTSLSRERDLLVMCCWYYLTEGNVPLYCRYRGILCTGQTGNPRQCTRAPNKVEHISVLFFRVTWIPWTFMPSNLNANPMVRGIVSSDIVCGTEFRAGSHLWDVRLKGGPSRLGSLS